MTRFVHLENSIPPATLLRFRLRWYAVSTARVLLRRWQALLLAFGVLAAANSTLWSHLNSLATPLMLLLAPGHGAAWRFGYLLVLQAVAVMWALMQREQIGGGAFMRYAGSLPLSARYRRGVDLTVLLLADSPLLLVLVSAMIVGVKAHAPGATVMLMVGLGLLALAAQLGALERRRLAWLAVAAADLLLAAAIGTPYQMPACGLAALLAAALLAAHLPPVHARWRMAAGRLGAAFAARLSACAMRLHPAILISFSVLLRQRRAELTGKALGAACIAALALGLMRVFDYDARAVTVAVMAQTFIALSFSGLYRGLQMAHQDAARYFAALPLRPAWWRRFDIASLATLALPFLAAPGAVLLLQHAGSPARMFGAVAASVALLAVLRAPQLFNERHAVVLSSVVAALWCAVTLSLIHQE
ncbi:MAG: hypothetical protein ABIT83_02860 [Massilia sp.]